MMIMMMYGSEKIEKCYNLFFANGFVLQTFYTLPSPKAAVRSAAEVNLVSVNFRIVHKKMKNCNKKILICNISNQMANYHVLDANLGGLSGLIFL